MTNRRMLLVAMAATGMVWESAALRAEDYPSAEISNGQIRAKVYLPDAQKGFYRSTRFDWSGHIGSLQYGGHEFYGPWFYKIADVYDLAYDPLGVVSAPFTAGVGPSEEFYTNNNSALGYAEAKPGETFIKIGVGVLRKPEEPKYDHSKPYELVDPGKWSVKTSPDSIETTQVVSDPSSGYGYTYTKTMRLAKDQPQMVIAHSLRNTGKKAIESTVYNHNFLVLDKQAPGPDFTITFPFQIESPRPPRKELAEIRGNQLVYLKTLEGDGRVATSMRGFSDSPKDHDIRVENSKLGVGFRVRADRPLSNVGYWSIRTVLAVEPFIAMNVPPGETFTWDLTYDYYKLPAKK